MNQKPKHGPWFIGTAMVYSYFHTCWQSSDNQLQNPLQVCKSASQFAPCYDNHSKTDQNRFFWKTLGPPVKLSSNNESILSH